MKFKCGYLDSSMEQRNVKGSFMQSDMDFSPNFSVQSTEQETTFGFETVSSRSLSCEKSLGFHRKQHQIFTFASFGTLL